MVKIVRYFGCFMMFSIIAFYPWSVVFPLDTAHNSLSIKGLDGVGVLVEPIPPDIETDGFTSGDIERQIIGQLKGAGIKVYTKEDFLVSLGRPAVYVNTEISKLVTEKGDVWGYLCSIDVALTQNVYLVRSPDQAVAAATWEAGTLGLFPDLASIRKKIEEAVHTFITVYKAVNETEKSSPTDKSDKQQMLK